GVGVRILFVQVLLNVGHQPVDLFVIINIDQKLNEGAVLPLGSVNKHETQPAAANERSDMGDMGLALNVLLNAACERVRFANIDTAGQKSVNHELRSCRGREKAL